jgi:hypothetical protein
MLIHSLFKSHTAHAAMFDDILNGLIEMTRRPLYSVSADELGTEPKELDERLPLILEIAQTWDAVLLLDEAEVFLRQRSTTDVTRNALVSILLGQLEYYQGILILTTNLIEQCDPAFFDPLPGSWLRLTETDLADVLCQSPEEPQRYRFRRPGQTGEAPHERQTGLFFFKFQRDTLEERRKQRAMHCAGRECRHVCGTCRRGVRCCG